MMKDKLKFPGFVAVSEWTLPASLVFLPFVSLVGFLPAAACAVFTAVVLAFAERNQQNPAASSAKSRENLKRKTEVL